MAKGARRRQAKGRGGRTRHSRKKLLRPLAARKHVPTTTSCAAGPQQQRRQEMRSWSQATKNYAKTKNLMSHLPQPMKSIDMQEIKGGQPEQQQTHLKQQRILPPLCTHCTAVQQVSTCERGPAEKRDDPPTPPTMPFRSGNSGPRMLPPMAAPVRSVPPQSEEPSSSS